MIDIKQLRENPERFKDGCRKKGFAVDIDHILSLEAKRRQLQTERERLRAEQARVEKEIGPKLGQMMGQLKKLDGNEKAKLQREIDDLKVKPAGFKAEITRLDAEIAQME